VRYVDPDGREDEKAQIVYFETYGSKEPITVSYAGNTYTLGKDLDFGDEVPLDAEFNVPKGTIVELETNRRLFRFRNGVKTSVESTIQTINERIAEKKSMKNRVYGCVEAVGGLVIAGLSAYATVQSAGSSATVTAGGVKLGFVIFAHGLTRVLGNDNGSIIDDLKSSLIPAEAELGKLRRP
jgi:hypothetical protein